MTFHNFRGSELRPSPLPEAPSVEGGACRAGAASTPKQADRAGLAAIFAMPDLGRGRVVGGRRLGAISLDREARVSGSIASAPAVRSASGPHTVALSDGTRITFSSADRLMESA